MKRVEWMGARPRECDLCHTAFDETHNIFIDGKTVYGPWAILCLNCHSKYGVGLGTGRGQKYDWESLKKLEG